MIRAVNLIVAIAAAIEQYETRGVAGRQTIGRVGNTGVAGLAVALLAKQRFGHCEQSPVVGAMRTMALAAIFGCRGVLPEKWATFLRMAIQAGIPRIAPDQQRIAQGLAMRLMAIATGHRALA